MKKSIGIIIDKNIEILQGEKFQRIKIDGKDTNYIVSSRGYVISFNRGFTKPAFKLKEEFNHGYKRVALVIDGKTYHKRVHRLVADAFLPNPLNLPVCHHKDDDKTNNDVSNLEWTTFQENTDYAKQDGLILYGENHPRSKITKLQAKEICELLEENTLTIKEIAQTVGTTVNIVTSIVSNDKWKSVSKDYDIKSYNVRVNSKRLEKDVIIQICKLLEKKCIDVWQISQICGVSQYTIRDIKQRKTYRKISKDFNF